MLRPWQRECIDAALIKYQSGQANFLAMATPGAGKTRMASYLVNQLFEQNKIDLVICFTPSVNVSNNFQQNLESMTQKRMNGRLGSCGQVMTYHYLSFINRKFWDIFYENRVLVIFDEIHHCGGEDVNLSNVWGEKILRNIHAKATYTLELSGTPWRSDKLPISLARYTGDPRQLECDYIYPLTRAVKEGVCRIPKIIVIDNDKINHTNSQNELSDYGSIQELLNKTTVSYTDLLNHKAIVTFILKQSIERLHTIRGLNPDAAGLIVASSVDHAYWIKKLLNTELKQEAIVVSHDDNNSHSIIEKFKHGTSQWIIAIGMISEGTDIPRLQVCCYLSRVKTELYYRQVLGRIVRTQKEQCSYAYFYTLADETLLEYAKRIGDDLPENLATIEIQQMDTETTIEESIVENNDNIGSLRPEIENPPEHLSLEHTVVLEEPASGNLTSLTDKEDRVSLSGQFFEELIVLQSAFNKAC